MTTARALATAGERSVTDHMGQTNVNTGGGGSGGFGAGMIVGIILLVVVVLGVAFYFGPQIFTNNTGPRSIHELFQTASMVA